MSPSVSSRIAELAPHTGAVSDLIDGLDRRYRQVRGQQDNVAFLRGIETYLAALDHERGVRKILKQLRRERKREVKRFRTTESSLIKEAEQIRRDLVVAAPEIRSQIR
jgi:hypothetical protein